MKSGMHGRAKTSAFSLVELLVATAVTLVVGGAAVAVIPRVFSAFGETTAAVRLADAADAFDASFDRDFASLVPERGFDGDRSHCAFWTIRQTAPGAFALLHVSYETAREGIVLAESSPAAYFAAAETNAFPLVPRPLPPWRPPPRRELFATRPAPFAFGGTNALEAALLEAWSSATGAPVRVATALAPRRGSAAARLYHRRTRP